MTAIDNIINQIEGETQNRGNTKTRIAAVLRLLRDKITGLFSTKLDKGNYTGTADDLRTSIDGKVDKVPGKILSSNDFTNELRTKLEGLRNVDISGLLPKGGYTGTAQNLKELIDNIMRILQSPDTELDELREIVAYIKQNKRILDTLGISNIAGLQGALNGKAPTDHNHDDRYSRLGHTHSEYALRTHRHNWDDIDRKPAFNYLPLTGGTVNGDITANSIIKKNSSNDKVLLGGGGEKSLSELDNKNIQVGGRNLVRETSNFILQQSPYYLQSNYAGNGVYVNETFMGNKVIKLVYNWQGFQCKTTFEDLPMVISFWAKTTKQNIQIYPTTDYSIEFINGNVLIPDGNWHKYTIRKNSRIVTSDGGDHGFIEFSNTTGVHIEEVLVSSFKIEYGDTSTIWSPAPEDLLVSNNARASSSITLTHAHNNATIFLEGITGVDMTGLEDLDSVSFRKCFTQGHVNFATTSGKQIVYTGDSHNMQEGGEGSTAVVSVYGNKIYVDIRNV